MNASLSATHSFCRTAPRAVLYGNLLSATRQTAPHLPKTRPATLRTLRLRDASTPTRTHFAISPRARRPTSP
jgi:hypothetical protein